MRSVTTLLTAALLALGGAGTATADHIVDLPCEKVRDQDLRQDCHDLEPNDYWCWGYPLDLCLPLPPV